MQDTQKREFTLRISQANRTQLTLIIYEIALAYMEEAETAFAENQPQKYGHALKQARKCVDELKRTLDFRYPLAFDLMSIYIYINKLMVRARIGLKPAHLSDAKLILGKLHDAFAEISRQDNSEPLIENAQAVYAGYTYGKNDVNVNIDNKSSNRGFLV